MSIKRKLSTAMVACVLCAGLSLSATTALASDAGAFLGGVVTAKVLNNMSERTEAEQAQAQAAQTQAYNQSAQASGSSAESRIAELDKLAAGGYITPAEYKAKKQQILDSM